MTRRIIVYKDRNANEGLYFVSQEFNGDREEAIKWNHQTAINANWNDIVELFNGIDSLYTFRKAVKKAEDLYAYENISLVKEENIPQYEEIWMLIDGKLQLYSKY